MLEKIEILFVIIILLLAFYFVILFGARSKENNVKIKKYLFGVKILIIIIGIVSFILWLFL